MALNALANAILRYAHQCPRAVSPPVLHCCSGDVALHALTDAILGALCLPDIGQLFPDTDPQWEGANSDTFIKEAVSCFQNLFLQGG